MSPKSPRHSAGFVVSSRSLCASVISNIGTPQAGDKAAREHMSDPLHASSPTCAQALRALSRYPGRTAFAWPGGSLSYQGTIDLIGRIQGVFMRLELQPGARVAFLTANRADTWCAGVAA